MKYWTLLLLSLTICSPVLGGHILALHFVDTGSYVRIMEGLLNTLAPYNKITLYSIVHDSFPHPNVTVVKVRAPPPRSFFFSGLFDHLCNYGHFYMTTRTMMFLEEDFVEEIFQDKNLQALLKARQHNFDALLTFSTFSEFTIQMAHAFNLPLIEVSAPPPFMHVNDAVGNPTYMTAVQSFYDRYPGDTFMRRVVNYVRSIEAHLRLNYDYLPRLESVTKKYLPPNTPSIAEVHRNTSLLVVNLNNAMGYGRPNMPNVVYIGGIHCRAPKPLPPDLEEFMTGSEEHGVIYFSFGSSIRSRFPDYIKDAIVRVLGRLPQRVLWKWNEEVTDVPSNVRVSKWYSQQDILGHNKTRLFITQSGLFSMHEAAYHGVPILSIPIAFDQPLNAKIAHDLGYCEYLNFCDFSEDKFYNLIQKMLADPSYKQNVKKLSKLMTDRPLQAHEELVWWVDYVVRHRGNPLVANIKEKSWGYSRMDADIILFVYVCVTVALLAITYIICLVKKYYSAWKVSSASKKKTE